MWMLGSGLHSAVYAGQLGLPFCHATFISPESSMESIAAYRERFQPSDWCESPHVSMAVAALAADTEAEARRLAVCRNLWVVRLLSGRPIAFPSPEEALAMPLEERERALLKTVEARSVVGTPDQVKARLSSLAERHGAEELVIVTITYDYASRLRSYELLAKEFGLKAS
jgi:luciferase family oxidoreductase group 1